MKKYLSGLLTGLLIAISIIAYAVETEMIEVSRNTITLEVNGQVVNEDNFVYEGRTFVQLRAIGEMLGKEVTWNGETRTAGIIEKTLEEATVSKNVDGDTIWVKLSNGNEVKVRFIGIDTPESTTQKEFYGEEASNYTKSILSVGKTIYLSKDTSEIDKYGRLLRYIWIDKPLDLEDEEEIRTKMFNANLLINGFANAVNYEPDSKHKELFKMLEQEAMNNKKGMFKEQEAVDIVEESTNTGISMEIDKYEEITTISNLTNIDIKLTGWKIVSERGNQEFIFPEYTLKANSTVTISSGGSLSGDLEWGEGNVWNNSKQDNAYLYDDLGNLKLSEMDYGY